MTTITIGFTESDRDMDYSSFCDGYRPGAHQERTTITVPSDLAATAQAWAEAAFIATNIGAPSAQLPPAERAIHDALVDAAPAYVRSLSVGDTVTVDGVTLACERVGWVETSTEVLPAGCTCTWWQPADDPTAGRLVTFDRECRVHAAAARAR